MPDSIMLNQNHISCLSLSFPVLLSFKPTNKYAFEIGSVFNVPIYDGYINNYGDNPSFFYIINHPADLKARFLTSFRIDLNYHHQVDLRYSFVPNLFNNYSDFEISATYNPTLDWGWQYRFYRADYFQINYTYLF